MSSSEPINPKRGEIWDINFAPQVGDEMTKVRPSVVINININEIQRLQLRIVVPITGWNPSFHGNISKCLLKPSPINGLTKESAADTFQIKNLSLLRFIKKRGQLTETEMGEIAASVAAIIDAA